MTKTTFKKVAGFFAAVIICSILQSLFYLQAVQFEVLAINELADGKQNFMYIAGVFAMYGMFVVVALFGAFLGPKVTGIIRDDFYGRAWDIYFRSNLAEHRQAEAGTEINFFVTKIENVARHYYSGIIHIFSGVVEYLMCLALLLYNHVIVGVVCFFCTLLLIALGSRHSKKLVALQQELQGYSGEVIDTDLSLLKGQPTIKNFRVQEKAKREFKEANDRYETCNFQKNRFQSLFSLSAIMGNMVVYFLVFIVSCLFAHEKQISIGAVAAILTLCSQLIIKSTSVFYEFGSVMGLSGMKKEVFAFLQGKNAAPPEILTLEEDSAALIDVRQVSMGYGEKPVLNDISLTLHKGEKIALVGESGIGKTTLFNGIVKREPVASGEICLFGHPIADLSEDTIYGNLCYVEQEPVIFAGTIFENITLGNKDEDKEYCEQVFCMMNLDKDGFDLYAHLEQDGTNISQGQRQRISLARGLFQRKKVLLLDEPFSALDAGNASVIEERIMGDSELSVICISHKLANSGIYDAIYRLTAETCVKEVGVC